MLKHKDIWHGIDRLAQSSGYSPSGLAKKAGLDPTSFNKSKRVSREGKERWPSTESIAKILSVTGVTMNDFISLIDTEASDHATRDAGLKIPVIGFAQAGAEGFFDEDGYPAGDQWDETDLPAIQHDSGAYGIMVSGDSMEPLYRQGDILIVYPDAQLRKGDRAVIRLKDGSVMAKEILKRGSKTLVLKSLNPDFDDINLNTHDIDWIARIAWVTQ